MITTGEMPIVQSNSGGGAAVRTIEVNYGGQPLFEDARSVANTLKGNYGFAGRVFVEALKRPEIVQALRETQKKQYSKLSGTIQDKQVLSASLLLAADRLADTLIFKDKHFLKAEDIMPYLVTQQEADINYRCYQWLMGVIGANPRRFDSEEQNNGEMWGCIEKEENTVYIIKTVFERLMRNEGYSTGAFLTWAKRNNKIRADEFAGNKRLTKRKTIGGNRLICVAIIMDNGEDEPENEREAYARYTQVDDPDMPF